MNEILIVMAIFLSGFSLGMNLYSFLNNRYGK